MPGTFEQAMDEIEDIFTYHAPTKDQIPKYEAVRDAAKSFARVLMNECPGSADRSAALRNVRIAVMQANASIALEGRH